MARDNPPNLIVLDWMLPGLDGLEVCRRLRQGGIGADPHAHRQATQSTTACRGWMPAQMTTWSNRSAWTNYWHAYPRLAAAHAARTP